VNQKAIAKTNLLDMDREFTMQEIAIITRAGPAKLLGLSNKGHLGIGADADITIYDELEDREAMFNAARYVIKNGELFIDNHEFCNDMDGRILHVAPDYDKAIENKIRPFFEDYYTIQFDNYAVADEYLGDAQIIPTTA
jgi:formylmethanofuran dehydrogenase subunit A